MVTRRTSNEPPAGSSLKTDNMLSTAPLVAAVLVARVAADSQSAVALTPSNGWYGVDGNWSTVELQVGTPGQTVNVLPSTSLSEFWVIGAGGCGANDPLCSSSRGGLFELADSKSWDSLGSWQLGLDYLDRSGNGDYGLETLSATLLEGNGELSMVNIITASINTTGYYLGFLGLGLTKGSFGNQVAESPLSQAVKTSGRIPSYSYGYTAGAHYMGVSGTPCSLTLGGYDESRFVQHDNEFSLDPSDGLPHALVRAIEVTTGEGKALPGGWNTSTRILSDMSTSFIAMIDSSTPYLWLPGAICDQFAQAFNLTYNSTLELYTLTDSQYTDFKSASSYSFTFSFTSHDNSDDLGHPLTVPGVVNITITAAAFAQALRYPFQSDAIRYGDPAVPYFPLRRASSLTDTFVIGRSFLQEAYLITKYDTGVFSLHQAVFPEEPLESIQVYNVAQPNNSPFTPPASANLHEGLSTAQMGGIAAGVIAACIIMLACWYFYRRQKKSRAAIRALDDGKDAASSIMPETPTRPVTVVFTKILGKKKAKRASAHEVMGSTSHPAEVGADATHALYELPVSVNPAELGGGDDKSALSHKDFEMGGRYNVDAYDVGTRNVEIRLQSPVPAYSPPETPSALPPSDKLLRDTSPVATFRPEEYGSLPSVSPTSLRGSLPSPLSFRSGEWTNRTSDLLSPWTDGHSLHGPASADNNAGNPFLYPVSPESEAFTPDIANSSNTPPPVPVSVLPASPLPTHRRAPPMEFTNVICLGPLPANFTLPAPPARPPIPPPPAPPPAIPDIIIPQVLAANRASTDTLGSNWTEFEEELIAQEMTRQESLREEARNQALDSGSPRSLHRLDGTELIHIPQPAERRYSWEN
ncbi:eukaryotic aspartyl protease [Colletotrichum caudatum]|nr:eukaryotic aspartyl protease [Colletotrichum caudatum]